MQIKLKLKSGAIHDMDVEDVLSIDGRPPFSSDTDAGDVAADRLAHLEGRVSTLETIICGTFATA